MLRSRSRSRAVVLAIAVSLLGTSLTGCTNAKLRVALLGFGNGRGIAGLWFFRLEGGTYKRICRFDISDPYLSDGVEVVDYSQTCLDGRKAAPWQAVVQRAPSNPANVWLDLVYRRNADEAKAPHRATAFNEFGESPLSASGLAL